MGIGAPFWGFLGILIGFDWFWVLMGFDLYHNDHWWGTTNQNRIWPALTWWYPKFPIISRGHGRNHSEGSNRDSRDSRDSLRKNKVPCSNGNWVDLTFDQFWTFWTTLRLAAYRSYRTLRILPAWWPSQRIYVPFESIWAMARGPELSKVRFFWGKVPTLGDWYPPVIKHG